MTRRCYLCDVHLLTAGDKCACHQCGTSYPFLPAVETFCSSPAQLPGGRLPPRPPGLFTTVPRRWQAVRTPRPAGSHPQQAGRGTYSIGDIAMTKRDPFLPETTPGDWLGGIALFAVLFAFAFIVGALQ